MKQSRGLLVLASHYKRRRPPDGLLASAAFSVRIAVRRRAGCLRSGPAAIGVTRRRRRHLASGGINQRAVGKPAGAGGNAATRHIRVREDLLHLLRQPLDRVCRRQRRHEHAAFLQKRLPGYHA